MPPSEFPRNLINNSLISRAVLNVKCIICRENQWFFQNYYIYIFIYTKCLCLFVLPEDLNFLRQAIVISNGNIGPESTRSHLQPLLFWLWQVLLHRSRKNAGFAVRKIWVPALSGIILCRFLFILKVGLIKLLYYSIYDDEMRKKYVKYLPFSIL